MHRILNKDYFWRYSYKSVTEYVQNCETCSSNSLPRSVPTEIIRKNTSPWKEIELYQIKPDRPSSSLDSHVFILIYDPVSSWVSATAIQSHHPNELAEFVFENFCNFGVASCTVHGLSSNQFMELETE